MITSFEVDEKVSRELETIAPLSNTITEMADYSISNLGPNPTTNALKKQEPLSPLEQANAEKLAKLESEKLDSGNKIFDFYSDRNFIDFKGVSRLPEITFNASKNTDTDIIHSFIPQARTLKK